MVRPRLDLLFDCPAGVRMNEPRTAAGRALLAQAHLMHKRWPATDGLIGRHDILAIEIEAYELGCAATARVLAPAPAEGLREAARDLYSALVSEHGHDETHSADWPACLPVHIAMNRYRAALTPEEPT